MDKKVVCMIWTNINIYRPLKYIHIFNMVFALGRRLASKLMPFTMDGVFELREYYNQDD